MAEKKDSKSAELAERIYTIPLRAEWVKCSRIRRAGKSAATVRRFLSRHMKAGEVKISEKLNKELWAGGLKKPPASIRVKARMDDNGVVTARLPEEIVIKEEEKGRMERLKERLGGGKETEKKPGKPAEQPEKTKEASREKEKPPETRELKTAGGGGEAPVEKAEKTEGNKNKAGK